MDSKSNLICFIFLCGLVGYSYAQVATLCRPNENFLKCGGCQKTCKHPDPACAAVCREGCYCPQDLVRNSTGHCIPISECPSNEVSKIYSDTSEPRFESCPDNEEYRFCEPCNRTCESPNPICPAQCGRGCFCKGEMVRNKMGICVPIHDCDKDTHSNEVKHFLSYMAEQTRVEIVCENNKQFKECSTCKRTCSSPNPVCPAQCTRGCFCKEGLLEAPNGKCVMQEDCPKETCADVNAEYACRYPCERICAGAGGVTCARRARRGSRCELGCHCKSGFLRNSTGVCVTPDKCSV